MKRSARILAWLSILAAASLIPLIIHLRIVPLERLKETPLAGWRINMDLYSWYKAAALIACSSIAMIGVRLRPSLLPSVLFFGLTVLSSALSEYQEVAWWGFPNHYFGCVAVLATGGIAWATAKAIQDGRPPWVALGALTASTVVVGGHALCEVYGLEPIVSAWLRPLLVNNANSGTALQTSHQDVLMVATTLYNSNYVGTYVAMLLPVAWVMAMRPGMRHWGMAAASMLFAIGVASCSRTGLLGAALGTGIALWLIRARISRPVALALVAIHAATFTVLALTTNASLGQRFTAGEGGHDDGVAIPTVITPAGPKVPAWGGIHDEVVPERASPCLNDRAFSSRGYIWCRTLPLLRRRILLGAGPDVFGAEFEQRDFKGKLNSFPRHDVVIDKPHSFYLQVAHGCGMLALLALLAMLWQVFSSAMLARRRDPLLAAACVGGLSAFLVSGLFNDLYIGVAPVFAVLAGVASGGRLDEDMRRHHR